MDPACDEEGDPLVRQLEDEISQLAPKVLALQESVLRAGPPVRLTPQRDEAFITRPMSHSELMAALLACPAPARGRTSPQEGLAPHCPCLEPSDEAAPSETESSLPTPLAQSSLPTPLAQPALTAPALQVFNASEEAQLPTPRAPADWNVNAASPRGIDVSRRLMGVMEQVEEWRMQHSRDEGEVATLARERNEEAQEVALLRAKAEKLEASVHAAQEASFLKEGRLKALEVECAEQASLLPMASRSRWLEQNLESEVSSLRSECREIEGRLRERSSLGADALHFETRLAACESQCALSEARADALEVSCAEASGELLGAQRAQQHLQRANDDLADRLGNAAAANQRLQAELDAARQEAAAHASARQQLQRASDDLAERLGMAGAANQRLQAELEDVRQEAGVLCSARQQLQAQLDDCESGWQASERRLQVAQMQLGDVQALQIELRQSRQQAHSAAELLEAKQRLSAEVLRFQGEASEARTMQQQERLWALQLQQENEQLLTDLRASGTFAESLQAELRGSGERATDHHARCCDLWVALENQRLEAQRLRETVDVARRENLSLSQRLRQQQQQQQQEQLDGPTQRTSLGSQEVASPGRTSPTVKPPDSSGHMSRPRFNPVQHSGPPPLTARDARASLPLQTPPFGGAEPGSNGCSPTGGGPPLFASCSRTTSSTNTGGGGSSSSGSLGSGLALSGGGAGGYRVSPGQAFGPRSTFPGPANAPLTNSASLSGSSGAEEKRAGGSTRWPVTGAASSTERLFGARTGQASPTSAPSSPGVPPPGRGITSPSGAASVGVPGRSLAAVACNAAAVQQQQPPDGAGDTVSRIMRQGHFSHEAEIRRERQAAALEKQLTVLNGERQHLEGTLMKFPSNTAGRTLAERRQKRDAEDRLSEVDKTITELRQSLRRLQEAAA